MVFDALDLDGLGVDVQAYQQQFEFPEISVGLPQPLEIQDADVADGVLQGRPASRGIVEGVVRVARAQGTAEQPARVLLVAAMNPCPCGYLGATRRACRCSGKVVERYRRRLSGPPPHGPTQQARPRSGAVRPRRPGCRQRSRSGRCRL